MLTIGIIGSDQIKAANFYTEIVLEMINRGAKHDQDHLQTINVSIGNHKDIKLIAELLIFLGADLIVVPSFLENNPIIIPNKPVYSLNNDIGNIKELAAAICEYSKKHVREDGINDSISFKPNKTKIPTKFIRLMKQYPNITGAICGAGPLAGAIYCLELAKRSLPFIMLSDCMAPGKNDHVMGKGKDFRENYLNDLLVLEPFVSSYAIACNTAHVYYNFFQEKTLKPILDIREASLQMIKQNYQGVKEVIILGTTATIKKSKIYHDKLNNNGINLIEPTENETNEILEIIYEIKENKAGTKEKILKLVNTIRERAEEKTVVLLACTELNVVFNDEELRQHDLISTSHALADYVIDFNNRSLILSSPIYHNHIISKL